MYVKTTIASKKFVENFFVRKLQYWKLKLFLVYHLFKVNCQVILCNDICLIKHMIDDILSFIFWLFNSAHFGTDSISLYHIISYNIDEQPDKNDEHYHVFIFSKIFDVCSCIWCIFLFLWYWVDKNEMETLRFIAKERHFWNTQYDLTFLSSTHFTGNCFLI